jgi:hypothetical protein
LTQKIPLVYALAIRDASASGVLDTLESRLESMQGYLPGSIGLCFYRGQGPDSGRYKRITFIRVRAKSRGSTHLVFPLYLWRWLRANSENPRRVVVRYHFPSPLFWLLFRKRNFTLVSEHHTNLETNLSTLDGLGGRFLPHASRALRPTTDCVIDGKIGLTAEILRNERATIPALVVGNGVDAELRSTQAYRLFDGQTLNVVTVISADWKWNGLERMILSMEDWAHLNPDISFNLTIIGRKPSIRSNPESKITINLLGPKEPQQISNSVGDFHFAFSSLGAFRLRLNEGCPLKSRMYIGLGLPYLSAYIDPDIDDSRDFVMRCENSARPIEWQSVLKFLVALRESRVAVQEDFAKARQELAHVRKSKQIIDFIEALAN